MKQSRRRKRKEKKKNKTKIANLSLIFLTTAIFLTAAKRRMTKLKWKILKMKSNSKPSRTEQNLKQEARKNPQNQA